MRAVLLVVCTLFLSACGGGGGGTPAPAIALNPSKVIATYPAGTSVQLSVVATPTIPLTGTIYVTIIDHNGVLEPTATLTQGAGQSYTVGLMTSASLKVGHYADSFQVNLCYDAGCAQPVAGSPVSIPFDFTVTDSGAAYTLTPTALSESFSQGSPTPLTVTVTPVTPFNGSVNVSLADPTGVLSAMKPVKANSDGSYSITVQPAASLLPGHVTGTLSLNLCTDSTCASPLPGSPVPVPYDFTIVAAPVPLAFSAASANGTFTAGDPLPFLINMQAKASTGLSISVLRHGQRFERHPVDHREARF
jgi:hypothetical protein